jgi:hypothetical protein
MKNKEELRKLADSLTESEIAVLLSIILDDHPMLILNRSDVEFVGVPIADYTRLVRSETELKVIYAMCESYRYEDNTFRKFIRDCKDIRG